jgi:hypothetical protein
MIKLRIRTILALGIAIFATNCTQQKTSQNSNSFFFEQDYQLVDTILTDQGLEKLMFIFEHDQNSEKIYIAGDSITHIFGNFDKNGTLWADEYIKYTKNGQVIDDESFYVHVAPSEEKYLFTLFAPKTVFFLLRKYDINGDSLGNLVMETKPTRKHQINNSELVGGAVAIVFTETIIENGEKQKMIKEIFLGRESKESNQKLFKYLKDTRL